MPYTTRYSANSPYRVCAILTIAKAASSRLSLRRTSSATKRSNPKRRQAVALHDSAACKSAISRSGISSRICSADSPAAKRSRISVTRMRMPRIQGRPPHWSELNVIRSIGECFLIQWMIYVFVKALYQKSHEVENDTDQGEQVSQELSNISLF